MHANEIGHGSRILSDESGEGHHSLHHDHGIYMFTCKFLNDICIIKYTYILN